MDVLLDPPAAVRRRAMPPRPGVLPGAVLDFAAQGFIVFDANRRICLCNRRAAELLRLEPDAARRYRSLDAILAASPLPVVLQERFLTAADGLVAGTETVEPVPLGAAQAWLQPLSDRRWLATFDPVPPLADADRDPLTGLSGRAGFRTRLSVMLAERAADETVAVLMFDLNRFKTINDSLGHAAGDAVLQSVAQRLRSAMREGDLVSRLGADEFAVAMFPALHAEGAAERLVALLSRPYAIDGHTVSIGASAGVATGVCGAEPGSSADGLIRGADLALCQAKLDGRCSVRVFDPAMQVRARARHALEADLRAALALQQFELHYQPQVNLATGALVGFEALARWRHPVRGLVPPDEFIPVAEELGLIIDLGAWVLNAACSEAATWPAALTVAVNVSAVQLADRDHLPRLVESALAASGLPGARLEVEITESALVRQREEALHVLQALHGMGVRVSMDDFGTGYSSLSQLRSFPFDKIKIDRSFVRDLTGAEAGEAGAVVRAIAALGTSLGMTTTAEGVETPEQEALVRAESCTDMQGYLVSRPVPRDQVPELIQRLSQPYTARDAARR